MPVSPLACWTLRGLALYTVAAVTVTGFRSQHIAKEDIVLRLPRFSFYTPKTVTEVLSILGDLGPKTMLVAGGTDVYPKLKRRQFHPTALVGWRNVSELAGIRGDHEDGMTIGSGTTLTQIASHPELCKHYAGLAGSAGSVSTPVLRNVGTLGGNLCLDTRCNYYDQTHEWRQSIGGCKKAPGDGLHPDQVPCRVAPGSPRCWAVSSTDTSPMLVALDAEVTLVSPRGERRIPVAALFGNDGMNYLAKQRDELLTTIHLPPGNGQRSAYKKLRRRGSFDFPVLGAAATLRCDENNVIRQASVVLGGVASFPLRVTAVEEQLLGQTAGKALFKAASQAAFKPARPMDNTDYHLYYRKKMVPVYVERALEQAFSR